MSTTSTRERLLASSMICGVALLAGVAASPAEAQTASKTAEVSEIVVTGSRIPTPNLTSVSPITAVSSQEFKLEGTTNVENLLNNLPQVFASQSSTVSNGTTGTATVNLRGLGSTRTLVLVDGHRLMPGDPRLPVADLNAIPAGLVNRVDVLTGGASAVYGSDALGGVVNFIMNRDFEGFRIDAQYSGYQHHNHNSEVQRLIRAAPFPITKPAGNVWDGETTDITAMMGLNAPDGKGNVTAYVGYRNLQPILQGTRDFSDCVISATYTGSSTIYDAHVCSGSSNSAFGRFSNANTGGKLTLSQNGARTFVPFTDAARFNFAPQNYFQRPDDRYTAGYYAHYDINKMVRLYSDFMFADDHTVAQLAPSGLFQGTGANGTSTFGINCDNPFLSASQQTAICGAARAGTPFVQQTTIGFRFGNPRQDNLRHTSYLITLGSRGELNEAWNYDAYLQYGTSIYSEHFDNEVSVQKVQNALLVDPVTGQCQIGASTGCVPIDLFKAGGISAAALGYTVASGFQSGETSEQIVSASITGDLGKYGIKFPWATDGVGVALGAEYRRDTLDLKTDSEFSSGDLSGQGGPRLGNSGSIDVYELYGEARLPLIQDLPFAKDVSVELGYRFSDYDTATGTTEAYKVGGSWQVNDDVKLRASYNRAVRAPNVVELFTPTSIGLFGGLDPCAGNSPNIAACKASGATAAQLTAGIPQCPAAQCSALFGGNANLQAEVGDTYTAGIVLRPHFLPGFDLTIDYFNIKVANLISSLPALSVIGCVRNGDPGACALFHRDPTSGAIFGSTGFVNAVNLNSGFLKTSGADIAANYHVNLADWGLGEWGSLGFSLVGTWTQHYITQPVTGGGTFDCAGLYGVVCSSNAQGGPIPEWRHRARVTWNTPWPVSLSASWRYIGGVDFDVNQSNNFLHDPFGRTDIADAHIRAFSYLDLAGTWKVRDAVTLRFGVNNVLDKDPPVLDFTSFPASSPPTGNGNTYPGTYDALGRTIFVGVTADF